MEHLTESIKQIAHNSPKPLITKDIISEVKMMKNLIQLSQEIRNRNPIKQQTKRSVKMTKNQR